ncbi:hypothetical protein [Sedimentitalea sp.]|uniref:hypothetical protein n=1 Tax=Sedimentitalea sp. TaxID=2048915 RepID=UPI003299CB7E
MRIFTSGALVLSTFLTGCAFTDVQPLTATSFRVSTEGAPVCAASATRNVAFQAGAIEVIKRGGDRFIVAGNQSRQSSGGAIYNPDVYGGTVTTMTRSNEDVIIQMLSPGDPGYDNGLSARQVLGADWEAIVAGGTSNTC